jgi:hypothetical protein
VQSVERVREWTGRRISLFAYPNGETGEFSEMDKVVLRSRGITGAVTSIPGANAPGYDLLRLRRYMIGMHHDSGGFAAEVAAFRSLLKNLVRLGQVDSHPGSAA